MAVLISDVLDAQHGLGAQRVLDTQTVLIACRKFVVVHVQAVDGGGNDWERQASGRRRAGLNASRSAVNKDVVDVGGQAERSIGTGVVHVVALNALVHDAESAADDGLATAGEVISKAKAWTEGRPMIVHKALRDTETAVAVTRDADSVQIDRNASENGIRAGAESGTDSGASCVSRPAAEVIARVEGGGHGRVIELRVEIPHAVVGFVSVRHTIPAQAEVKS